MIQIQPYRYNKFQILCAYLHIFILGFILPISSYAKNRMEDFVEKTNNFYIVDNSTNTIKKQKIILFPGIGEPKLKELVRGYMSDQHVFQKAETESSDYLSKFDGKTFYIYDKFVKPVLLNKPATLNYLCLIEVKDERIRVTYSVISYDLPTYGNFNAFEVYPFEDSRRINVEVKNWTRKLLFNFIPYIEDNLAQIEAYIKNANKQLDDEW